MPPQLFHIYSPADRLIDQIQCDDPRIRDVFYYMLQDTLVVDNLEEAARIDARYKGRYRITTLDGTNVEKSGTMTGGGKPYSNRIRTDNGVMTQDKKNAIAKLTNQLTCIKKEHEVIEKKLKTQQEIYDENGPIEENLKARQREIKDSIPIQTRNIASLKSAITKHEQQPQVPQIEISEADIEAKRAAAEELRAKLQEVKNDSEQSKKMLEESQRKLDKMFQDLVQSNKDLAAKARERVERINVDMIKEETLMKNTPAHLEALDKKIKEHEELVVAKKIEVDVLGSLESNGEVKELMDLNNELTQLKTELSNLEARLKEIREIRENLEAVEKEATEEYQGYKSYYDELYGMLDAVEGQLDEKKTALERLDDDWLEPETLDPQTNLVRPTDENVQEKLANGAMLLPPEVCNMIVPHRVNFESEPIEMLPPQEAAKIRDSIVKVEKQLKAYRIEHDEIAISQYAIIAALWHGDETDLSRTNEKVAAHRKKLQQLRAARLEEFSEALAFLGTTTQMLYQLITNGGDASLKFVEEGKSSDPFEAGVKFSVRPAKKSWKLIENLSGGEKTLASLCFVFAMHHYRATPLYVMDEIDAALDLNNVRLIANYIKHSERTRNAQFIIISLRNQMFEVGNRLIGIYKTFGCTHNVVIAPESVENGNRVYKSTLDEQIREETKKKNAEKEAEAERTVVEGIQNMAIKRGFFPKLFAL
uniref:Structural maintenance of chromosomes protein 4 n=1 Tax=Caenorhabditis japonica TaxID=281687 RepID=A0A8R1EBE4_CAEJA